MNECYVIKLYGDSTIRGVFPTEKEARIAAQHWLDKVWAQEEEMIELRRFEGEDDIAENEEEDLRMMKEMWREDGFIDDILYIERAPFGVLETIYEGNFYGI